MEGEVPLDLAAPWQLARSRSRPTGRAYSLPILAAWTVVPAGILLVYLPVFVHAVGVWSLDPTLSFGFFGPPGAMALLVMRRNQLIGAANTGTWLGLPILISGLLVLVVGYASGVHAIAGLSLLPTCLGVALYLAGVPFARVLILPLILLTSTLIVYLGFLNALGFWMQQLTAAGAASAASIAGTHVLRTGVDLYVGRSHFVVAEACSGMNSLLALLYLGMFVATFVLASWPSRLLLLACALPIVLVTNIVRVTVVLVTAGSVGSNLEAGLPHDLLSAGMFLFAGTLFVLLALVLRKLSWPLES